MPRSARTSTERGASVSHFPVESFAIPVLKSKTGSSTVAPRFKSSRSWRNLRFRVRSVDSDGAPSGLAPQQAVGNLNGKICITVPTHEISTSRPLNAHSCVGSVCGSWTADHEIAKIQGDRGGESGVGPRSIFLSMYLYTPQSEKGILNRFFFTFFARCFCWRCA